MPDFYVSHNNYYFEPQLVRIKPYNNWQHCTWLNKHDPRKSYENDEKNAAKQNLLMNLG